jgi:hypothetical protein
MIGFSELGEFIVHALWTKTNDIGGDALKKVRVPLFVFQ